MQIRIEGQLTGVIGLEEIIKAIAEHPGQMSDSEIAASLLIRIQKLNYVPAKREEAYRKALLREYKKYMGMRWRQNLPEIYRWSFLAPAVISALHWKQMCGISWLKWIWPGI